VCFEFLYNLCLRHFSFFEELSEIRSKMYIGLHIKYPLFLSYFNEKFLDIFSKNTQNIKFHTNPSSRSRIVSCGRTAAQTDMAKLTVAFTILQTRVKIGLSKLMHSSYRLECKHARIINPFQPKLILVLTTVTCTCCRAYKTCKNWPLCPYVG